MVKDNKTTPLGRGIASLLNVHEVNNDSLNIVNIKLSECVPSRYQAREDFNEDALQALSISIKDEGVLSPIWVRRVANKYEIIAGERRYRASLLAGLPEIPAIIMENDEVKSLRKGLIENLQRQDLHCLEEAKAYKRLIDEYGYTVNDVALLVGKARSTISHYLRILNLPAKVLQLLLNNQISFGHAKVLLSADDPEVLLQQIIDDNLSVRNLELLITENKASANILDDNHASSSVVNRVDKSANLNDDELDQSLKTWKDNLNNYYFDVDLKVNHPNKGDMIITKGKHKVKIKYNDLALLKEILKIINE